MLSARISMLASLRGTIGRLEGGADGLARVALGHADADATLQGGLVRGALHEVFTEGGRHAAAATGFIAGLAHRLVGRRPLVWVRQDFGEIESGALSMEGLNELGLDPRLVVTVRAPDAETALRAAADALACDALGAVVLDVWGEVRALDLVASRRLTLAARASSVACLVLRTAAMPSASTAETRWVVRAAPSSPTIETWGAPMLDAQLVRNRHGQTGRWIMEWKCDDGLFREGTFHKNPAYPQPVAAAPADRPLETPVFGPRRRAG
ncbi:DNA repair protein [Bradyrhizobium sp. G127]|uniref:ImuA family protein n=1 Tax=Bradyrhizobium sp. G127 TaxID=2904800 RepID=UPI001F389FF7|nr:DNA repair protein [Bradyrhizobium sp. G127]MCF2522947.1 DNA repair protein [Bradyrhizobium sp. G127]